MAELRESEMEQHLSDIEYANTDATKDEVRAAIRAAKVIMQRPLPLTHALPRIALVGYQEEKTGRYMILKEFRVFQTGELFASMTSAAEKCGYVRLIALRHMTREEYESVNLEDLPNYRVYESIDAGEV